MRSAFLSLCLPLAVIGCATDEPLVQRVPDSPFGAPVATPPPTRAGFAPAASPTSLRVDKLGREIMAANPQIGLRPLFVTIGSPKPEVFHRECVEIDITEGLVKQCATDGQLAAILCSELGKMVAERQTLAAVSSGSTNEEPPMAVRIGNDSRSDLTYLAEQAKYRPAGARQAESVAADPKVLARDYLSKAGFASAELDAAEPLLRGAAANSALERQLTHPGPARPWTN
jgi:hypothetical protein